MPVGHRELSWGGAGTPALVPIAGGEFGDSAVSHCANTFIFSLKTLAASVSPPPGRLYFPASGAHPFFFFLSFLFSNSSFTGKGKNIPKVSSAPCRHSCVPVSVTLAGGSQLGLVPPSWPAAHVPPRQPGWAMGGSDPHTPILLTATWLPLGKQEERGCFSGCFVQRGLSIAPQ